MVTWKTQRIVKWWTVLTFIGIVLIDIVLWQVWGEETTISWQVRRWGSQWPMLQPLLAFGAGVLWGHFFWQMSPDPEIK